VTSTPPLPKRPDDADAWLDAYCDGGVIRIEEEIRAGADVQRVRSAQMRSLSDALSGTYAPGGVQRRIDLADEWYVLRVLVAEDTDYAGLGGGPLSARPQDLRTVRHLVEAALAHVST
jgi:hypothetical protein